MNISLVRTTFRVPEFPFAVHGSRTQVPPFSSPIPLPTPPTTFKHVPTGLGVRWKYQYTPSPVYRIHVVPTNPPPPILVSLVRARAQIVFTLATPPNFNFPPPVTSFPPADFPAFVIFCLVSYITCLSPPSSTCQLSPLPLIKRSSREFSLSPFIPLPRFRTADPFPLKLDFDLRSPVSVAVVRKTPLSASSPQIIR